MTPRAVGGARRRSLLLGVSALTVLLASACAPRGRTLVADPGWMGTTGFAERADWPSTLLHRDAGEIQGAFDLSRALEEGGELRVLDARGEGLGVHRVTADGRVGCELEVWFNGTRQIRVVGSALDHIDDLVRARDVSGFEVHLGPRGPVRLDSGCGALLVWSERRARGWDPPFRGTVAGRLVEGAAETVDEVVLEPAGERLRPDARGRFRFGGVLPGSYRILLRDDGAVVFERPLRVWAFQVTTIHLGPDGGVDSLSPSG